MPFVQTNVNYAAEYSRAVANAYPYYSYFAPIWASENSNLYKPGMGKTMYIPSFTVKGASAVDRDNLNGVFARNWNNSLQAVSLDMDREWSHSLTRWISLKPMMLLPLPTLPGLSTNFRRFLKFGRLPE
jgi:hypothetical protein